MSIGMGMGLRAQNSNSAGLRANSPSLNLDFIQQRYSMSLISKAFADIFTFTRASAATRINAAGVMESVAANQPRFDYDASGALLNRLTWSNDLTNAVWTKSACSVSKVSTTLPDGSTGLVNRVTVDSSTGLHRVGSTITIASAVRHSVCVDLKADGIRYVYVNTSGTIAASCVVDLQTGAVLGAGANILGLTCDALENGWYRTTYNGLSGATVGGVLLQANSTFTAGDSSFNGNGTDSFFVLAAGEFQGTVTSAQVTSAGGIPITTTAPAYNPAAIARKGIFFEEQRTNYLSNSNDFTNSAWTKSNLSLTTGVADPWGGNTATTLTANATNAGIYQYISSITGLSSVWMRRRSGVGVVKFRTLSAGGSSPIVLTSEWKRLMSDPDTGPYGLIVDIVTSGDAIDICCAQCEAGTFPSSYIPTTTAQATRAADSVIESVSPWFNSSKGTISYSGDISSIVAGKWSGLFSFNDGTNANRIGAVVSPAGQVFFERFISGAAVSCFTGNAVVAGSKFKVALSWDSTNLYVSLNGGTIASVAHGGLPAVTQLCHGRYSVSSDYMGGHEANFKYTPKTTTGAALQALSA